MKTKEEIIKIIQENLLNDGEDYKTTQEYKRLKYLLKTVHKINDFEHEKDSEEERRNRVEEPTEEKILKQVQDDKTKDADTQIFFESNFGDIVWDVEDKTIIVGEAKFSEEELLRFRDDNTRIHPTELHIKKLFPTAVYSGQLPYYKHEFNEPILNI